jgi:hypothetical protein
MKQSRLRKLVVAQLVTKFIVLYGRRGFRTTFTRARHTLILSLTLSLFKIHSIPSIFPPPPSHPNWILPFRFHTKPLYAFLFFLIRGAWSIYIYVYISSFRI